ncbi:hypothetical protein Vadar_004734 [Vaccinium darrowii]|uniref:Uncharacterized protein n=1 Tax=Vaccinium darrowii TaxID=229202 RepID=A0ACB7Z2F3_9ERIC|nr:hypothetical protein Vadar_004734 [Vaccinium darrowii]
MLSRPSPPCVPQVSFSFGTTTNPSQRFSSFAVSKKFERRPPPSNEGSIEDKNNNSARNNIGGLRLNVLTSLKSNPTAQSSAASIKTSNPKPKPKQQQEGKSVEKEEKELSGSDVLLALQRASAQKIKTKKQRKDYYPSSSSSTTGTNSGRRGINRVGEEANVNYGDVRPICVKNEWITRLDELEKRLQELMDEVQ